MLYFMSIQKQNLLFFLLVMLFFYSCSSTIKNNKTITYKDNFRVDTIQGYFLYEVNVPAKCFTRFDQIEQGNNLIFFDSLISVRRIEKLYQRGVFLFEYQPIIDQYINDHQLGLTQNKDAIRNFNHAISYAIHRDDSAYNKELYYDEKKILAYKKVYAKFSFVTLGGLKQLIPITENYKCCYSNKTEMTNSFFIIDVFNFTLL